MTILSHALTLLVGLVLLAGCGDDDTRPATAPVPTASVRKWERFEASLSRPVSESNPFDPSLITVDGEFESPSGTRIVMPAFVTRDYERQLVGGYEKVRPSGDLQWKIRFTPTQEGNWRWRTRVRSGGSVDEGEWSTLTVTAAAADAHGFVRRSGRDSRYLEFDDGTSFWAIGENMSWYDGRGTFAYDEWLDKLAAQGGNYIRLWMPSWAFGLEWLTRDDSGAVSSSSLGNYTARLDRAWQLDYVIEAARRRGIYVMLSIQYHGAFSLESNTEWTNNPYNTANGGMLSSPREFFSNPQAIELVKRRIRYIVARWGYAANIMTWELWNEVDLTEQPAAAVVADWHRDMARELRVLDPHDRLISTSTSSSRSLTNLWELDEIDYAQLHYYSFDGLTTDFPLFISAASARLRRFGKPVLIGELGVNPVGPSETVRSDPNADGFHDILWSGLVAETFGSGMSWWWDNVVDPQDLYFHFGPLAAFTAAVDFPGEGFQVRSELLTASDGHAVRVFTLQGSTTILVWIKNANHNWFAPDPSQVNGATVTLTGLGDAAWTVAWFDTRSGQRTVAGETRSPDGTATYTVPPFSRDIALRLDR